MRKFLQVISNPFLLPLIPAVVIILILPVSFDPFAIEVVNQTTLPENRTLYWDDLTNDGFSERMYLAEEETFTWITVYDHNRVLYDQWNFQGTQEHIHFPFAPQFTGDYNRSGQKEIYLFTMVQDSLLLHMVGDLEERTPAVQNRFIATVGPGRGVPDPRVDIISMEDITGDGYRELVFSVSSRFSLYPRRIFAYSAARDSLMKSPESYYNIRNVQVADITGDGSPEFLLSGTSAANVTPSEHHFHDHSNWLMVLDSNLEFLFEPVEIPGRAKRLHTFAYETDEETLIGTVWFRYNLKKPAVLSYYDIRGALQHERHLDMKLFEGFILPESKNPLLVLYTRESETYLYDLDKESITGKHNVTVSSNYIRQDLTGNGRKELVLADRNTHSLIVFRDDMQAYTRLSDELFLSGNYILSVIESPDQDPLISIQSGNALHHVSYGRNSHFYWSYAYFAGIYAGFFLFGMMTRYYQQNKISKKEAIEKKITELQLSLVKNQVNPHFSLNAINAAINSIRKDETEKAAVYLSRFARMHRAMVLSAETMNRSLAEEIEFTNDYIELEKLRFDHAFDSEINVGANVDTGVKLPKMILQGYAENAIKHGLSGKKGDGMLQISIQQDGNNITMRIADNGIGRKQAKSSDNDSTGMGYGIMNEYYRLYYKYYKISIEHHITDLYDENGRPSGTEVSVYVSSEV